MSLHNMRKNIAYKTLCMYFNYNFFIFMVQVGVVLLNASCLQFSCLYVVWFYLVLFLSGIVITCAVCFSRK